MSTETLYSDIRKNKQPVRGVNLGGWLVLEKWITPSLFIGTNAQDEFGLHKTQDKTKILNHYDNFLTHHDFEFLAEHKINALRIPVGHWVFGDYPPFPRTIEYLDFAFDQAKKYDFKVLIDLHTAPGSQNGYDHSGVKGKVNWYKKSEYISQTVNVIERLSDRYANNKNLYGISLLNEPHTKIPINILKDFYIRGFNAVRKYCPSDVFVVISDSFRPVEVSKHMTEAECKNVVLDTHFYQCFYPWNRRLKIEQIIINTKVEWPSLIKTVQSKMQILCGEWSLGIDPVTLSHLNPKDQILAIKEFGKTQIDIFDKTEGWFFWTYKTESPGGWNFKTSVEDGTLGWH